MPSWAKVAIDEWATAAGLSTGHVFRPMNNRHELTKDRLLEQNIMEMVTRYGQQVGVPKLAPHDLRRYAVSRTMPNRCNAGSFGVELAASRDRSIRHSPSDTQSPFRKASNSSSGR
jgi:integrase